MNPSLPYNEKERLAELYRLELLDSGPEQDFDQIVELASRICDTPVSLITLLDVDRQWFKSKTGVSRSETERNVAFCSHAILNGDIMVVPDALKDERFADNPLVSGAPFIRFYAGSPIVSNGYKLGTLCVIDTKPRNMSDSSVLNLKVLARQVNKLIELRVSNKKLQEQLLMNKAQNAKLRQFSKTNAMLMGTLRDKVGSAIQNIQSRLGNFQNRELSRDLFFDMFNDVSAQLSGTGKLIGNLAEWNETHTNEFCDSRPLKISSLLNFVKEKFNEEGHVVTFVSNDIVVHKHQARIRFILKHLTEHLFDLGSGFEIRISATSDAEWVLIVFNSDDASLAGKLKSRLLDQQNPRIPGTGLLDMFFIDEMITRMGGQLSIDEMGGAGTLVSFTFKNL